MGRLFRGIAGDRIFRAATISALVVLVVFIVGIMISMLTYSSWASFISAIFSSEILFAVKLSLFTATIAAIISVFIAIPVAYAISKYSFPGKDIIDSLLDLPIVVSPIALGAALLIFFSTPVGANINDHVRFVFAVPGIIIAQVTIVSALAIRLLKSTFDGIDARYEQVGRTLGCSKPEAFFRITLPMAKNGIIASGILTWARALGEFGATVTLVGAMAMRTETLPIAIFLNLAATDIDKAIAVVFILILIAIVALFIIRKLTGKKNIL
jgi:molybdate transport system permease protein